MPRPLKGKEKRLTLNTKVDVFTLDLLKPLKKAMLTGEFIDYLIQEYFKKNKVEDYFNQK